MYFDTPLKTSRGDQSDLSSPRSCHTVFSENNAEWILKWRWKGVMEPVRSLKTLPYLYKLKRRNVLFGNCRSWRFCLPYVQWVTRGEGDRLHIRTMVAKSITVVQRSKNQQSSSRVSTEQSSYACRSCWNDCRIVMTNTLKLLPRFKKSWSQWTKCDADDDATPAGQNSHLVRSRKRLLTTLTRMLWRRGRKRILFKKKWKKFNGC